MIYGTCLGLVCGIFVDFGNHVIIDEKGRESKSYYVKYITKDEEGLVSIDNISNTEKLDLGDGNYVKFQGVEGMVEVNDKEFQIYVENMTAFRIGDTSKFGNYEKGGIVYEIKKPKNVIFDDYKTRSEIIRGDKSTYYYTDFTAKVKEKLRENEGLRMRELSGTIKNPQRHYLLLTFFISI